MNWSNILTIDFLKEEIEVKGKTMKLVSDEVGCNPSTVRDYVKKYSIKSINIEKPTIEILKKKAKEYGGKCLSDTYINSNTYYEWECSEGHTWKQTWKKINQNTWCKRCRAKEANENRKLTIESMHEIAKQKNGKCLSNFYFNSRTKLKFKCKRKHVFEITPKSLRKGSWCKKCSSIEIHENKKPTMDEIREIARKRGGNCLSTSYVNAHKKLKWECSNGHRWNATLHNVKNRDSWCNSCNQNGGIKEEKCRNILEQLLDVKFEKTRKVLEDNLELDGYNKDLNLAFEYQGEQHYYFIKKMHHTKEKFKRRIELDEIKIHDCKNKDINLLVIPYWVSKSDENLISYIKTMLEKMNVFFDETVNASEIKIDLFVNKMDKIHDIAISKGGRCLNEYYKGTSEYYDFECKRGHRWKTTGNAVIHQGSWCQKCYGNAKYSLEQMNVLALKLGGKCLSNEYINTKKKMVWECSEGHAFEKSFEKIRDNKTWCTICRKNDKIKITEALEEVKNF